MQEIAQDFLGGNTQSGHVDTMLQGAPQEHIQGAIGDVLGSMSPGQFGQSVAQNAQSMTPEQQQGLGGTLLQAVERGGGSGPGVLSSLGIGGNSGGSFSPSELGTLASHVLENHSGGLSSVLGEQSASGGSGALSLFGNPMVQQVGMNVAQRLMGGLKM